MSHSHHSPPTRWLHHLNSSAHTWQHELPTGVIPTGEQASSPLVLVPSCPQQAARRWWVAHPDPCRPCQHRCLRCPKRLQVEICAVAGRRPGPSPHHLEAPTRNHSPPLRQQPLLLGQRGAPPRGGQRCGSWQCEEERDARAPSR